MINWIFDGVYKILTVFFAITFVLCACCLDSDDYAFFLIGMIASALWLLVSAYMAGCFEI